MTAVHKQHGHDNARALADDGVASVTRMRLPATVELVADDTGNITFDVWLSDGGLLASEVLPESFRKWAEDQLHCGPSEP